MAHLIHPLRNIWLTLDFLQQGRLMWAQTTIIPRETFLKKLGIISAFLAHEMKRDHFVSLVFFFQPARRTEICRGEAGMDPQLNGRRQERTVANRARRKKPRLSCHRARFVFDHVYLRLDWIEWWGLVTFTSQRYYGFFIPSSREPNTKLIPSEMGSTDKLRLKKEERERIAGARERERRNGYPITNNTCVI